MWGASKLAHERNRMRISPDRAVPIAVLALACVPATFVVLAHSPKDEAREQRLREDFGNAYRAKDWPKAIEAQQELLDLAPKNSIYAYNLACAYSRNSDADNAAKWLVKAAKNGFSEVRLIETDDDFDSIRESPGYKTALSTIKDNQKHVFASVKSRFLKRDLLIILPPEYDENIPAPLIVALHGGGSRPEYIIRGWTTVAAQMGAILVAPQAVYRLERTTGYSWIKPGDEYPDESDYLVRLTLDLIEERYKIDKERTILTGFSQGGFMAHAVGGRLPYEFAGVIPMGCPYIPAIDRPTAPTGNRPPRFYFMVGEHDSVIRQTRKAAEDFTTAGFDVKLRVYPEVAHTFPRNTIEELNEAVDYVLGQ